MDQEERREWKLGLECKIRKDCFKKKKRTTPLLKRGHLALEGFSKMMKWEEGFSISINSGTSFC